MARLLCFGDGYVAQALALLARARGFMVVGTHRQHGPLCYADGQLTPEILAAIAQASHILISIPPHGGEEVLAAAVGLHAPRGAWIGYLSTSGVYGDHAGRTVHETSACLAATPRTQARLHAEYLWRQVGAHVFRLSGIYGPGRSAFDAIRAGRAQRIHKPGHLFNRIHVEDIAAALMASMLAPTPGEIFNLADDLPAPHDQVLAYAYGLLGQPVPPAVPYACSQLSPMAAEFYAGCRLVDASKIKQFHGLAWKFPTYRHGLATILQRERVTAVAAQAQPPKNTQ
jgi:nucleoside-diphosphate-sugar epimerase